MDTAKQSGFTLIEVLVAMLVLSIGMLGSSGLLLRSQLEASQSKEMVRATEMAAIMAEMMRANITGVSMGAYDSISSQASDPGCITSGCTPATLAQYDAYIWGWMLDNYLPDGTGSVSGSGENSVFTINVQWNTTQRTGDSTGEQILKSYQLKFQP